MKYTRYIISMMVLCLLFVVACTQKDVSGDMTTKADKYSLDQAKQLFMKNTISMDGLHLTELRNDTPGFTHVYFNQYVNDLLIYGANIIYHFKDGYLDSVSGERYSSVGVSSIPRISKTDAYNKAKAEMSDLYAGRNEQPTDDYSVTLAYYFRQKNIDGENPQGVPTFTLAWIVRPSNADFPVVIIDANNSMILYEFDGIYTAGIA